MSYDLLGFPFVHDDAFQLIHETVLNQASEARQNLFDQMTKNKLDPEEWMIKDSLTFVDNKIKYTCWPILRPDYLRYRK